jgi:hypothetical protein
MRLDAQSNLRFRPIIDVKTVIISDYWCKDRSAHTFGAGLHSNGRDLDPTIGMLLIFRTFRTILVLGPGDEDASELSWIESLVCINLQAWRTRSRPSKFPAITVKFPHFCLLNFTHHAWSDFLPAFLNLTCRGFFLWGNYVYSHFFSLIAQCSNVQCILFANASIPRSLEKSWKCMSQSHIKKIQAGRLLSLRSAIFCRLGRRDANISYFYSIFIAWTHKVCASKKAEEKPRKGNFLAICGTKISPRARQLSWRPVDTNLRKLSSRIKFFKTWQVCRRVLKIQYNIYLIIFYNCSTELKM